MGDDQAKTKRVFRIDAGMLRSPTRTPQGFLRVDGYAGRVGVYPYVNEDGTTRLELRLPEEVFRADALASFEGAPLTDGHPTVPVSAKNVRQLEVGTVTGPARQDGEHVAVATMFKDPTAIAKVESGKRQLSPGYTLDLDETPGVHPLYGRYDAIQRNITINHLALVDQARGGSSVKLRMDGADIAVAHIEESSSRGDGMAEQRTDAEKIGELSARVQTLTDANAELQRRLDEGVEAATTEALKKERERADSVTKALDELKASIPGLVAARTALERKARTAMGPTFRVDGLDDRALRVAVIQKLAPGQPVPSDANDGWLEGRFDSLVEQATVTRSNNDSIGAATFAGGAGARRDEATERAERERNHREQWKQPLASTIHKGS